MGLIFSPGKHSNFITSPSKTKKFLKQKLKKEHPEELKSPTSEKMQNSFLIKNADMSFDTYYDQMRR